MSFDSVNKLFSYIKICPKGVRQPGKDLDGQYKN